VGNELHRAALREPELQAELLPYWRVSVVDVTGSTQIDLAESIHAHTAIDGDVLIANYQSAGKGRLDREFTAPPSSALLFSFYKKVSRPREEWNFLSLLAALSIRDALQELDKKLDVTVKWPNDILIKEKKVAGLLSQATADGVIIGIGLNVTMNKDEIPVDSATSLILEDFIELDRNIIIKKILQVFEKKYSIWNLQGSAQFISEYKMTCSSLHRQIHITLPNRSPIDTVATGVTLLGELILQDGTFVNSADILHLR
jgi:BirA family biotin operon repressor/biotin-[acetyl-CoA-carboxylase] ligase